jgi:hypothetical protein
LAVAIVRSPPFVTARGDAERAAKRVLALFEKLLNEATHRGRDMDEMD